MIFTGIYRVTVDSKGRFSIPADFRQQDRNFRFMPHPAAKMILGHCNFDSGSELESLSVIFSKTKLVDKDGRMILSVDFREKLNLSSGDNLAIVGMGNHFQIWNESDWNDIEPHYRNRLAELLLKESVWTPPSADK